MTKIAISIRPLILNEGLALFNKVVQQEGDYTEIWCDQLKLEDAKELVKKKQTPVIVNLKDAVEGGKFSGTYRERLQYLSELANYGAEYIDLPYTNNVNPNDLAGVKDKLILSFHDFQGTPPLPDLERLVDNMAQLEPAVIKVATQVNREIDLINLMRLQLNNPQYRGKRVIIGMGEKGRVTRALAPMFENIFTFACMDEKSKTAPGQLTANELREEWLKLNLTNWWN